MQNDTLCSKNHNIDEERFMMLQLIEKMTENQIDIAITLIKQLTGDTSLRTGRLSSNQ